jgi:tetratricopeptide (TPR) repeat protein
MHERKKTVLSYFDNLCLLIIGILFVLFPIFFFSSTTDAFVEPKQMVLIILSTIALLLFGIKSIISGRLSLRTSPFDIPVFLLIIITFASAILSTNRYDALIAFAPFLYVGFIYLVVVNTAKTQKQLLFLLAALTGGTVLASLLTIFSYFNVYLLPFSYTHATYFTTFGSLLDQALYYAIVLPIAGYFGYGYINTLNTKKSEATPFTSGEQQPHRKKSNVSMAGFGIAFIIIAVGLGLTVYMLFTTQKPLILPFSIGLQTGFAAISQSNNIFKNLLLGSGFGTFLNDFTQFKPASYNADETLWAFTFFRSSSFVLELLATTGLLGIAVFGFLIYRIIKEKNYFLPLMIAVLAALALPFSFTILALFFFLLAVFAVVCIQNNPHKFGEAEFSFAAFKRSFLGKEKAHEHEHTDENRSAKGIGKILPSIFLIFVLAFAGSPLYFVARFIYSDLTFQQSLIAESQNNGLATYQLQTAAITLFPYRDIYYRSFSQTNLALANALATNQPKGSSPSAQVQKDILTLIQQSINAGRAAITVAPDTSFNWNNLSSIYRSLIGFGQNADQFTVLTLNQAIALDPNNPQQYIDLGGVDYQLGKYDDAIREFQIAINLKQDYANAYYNLGHAYQQKGDYQDAMTNYQEVKQLVSDSGSNSKIIDNDIAILNNIVSAPKSGAPQQALPQASNSAKTNTVPQNVQQPITVNQPNTPPLPTRNPQETIPGPTVGANPPAPTSGQ